MGILLDITEETLDLVDMIKDALKATRAFIDKIS